uniref:ShKT domain-containing protein n=1 Tax=Enterobius vermicularis TaxID=51028 RepID=A0A0N4V6M2_ENTVE
LTLTVRNVVSLLQLLVFVKDIVILLLDVQKNNVYRINSFDNFLALHVQLIRIVGFFFSGHPFRMNCDIEEDDKGELCLDWARSGLCLNHRPTMFLFCRRTCLCIGPPNS